MPQMAPINWLALFIMFTITYLMFNIVNYFIFKPKITQIKKNKNIAPLKINWKW